MGIAWSEMMSVGVPALDADHRVLIGLVNHLQRAIGDTEEYATLGSVLQSLVEYVEHHFAREEQVMQACRYPQLEVHRTVHRRLAEQVLTFSDSYRRDQTGVRARECLNFLHRWLIDHICSTDMDYRPWVVGHDAAMALPETAAMTDVSRESGAFDWRTLTILVVDDNDNFCQVLRTILESVGVAEIVTVHDVASARTALENTPFDMVVTDWHVGEDSGLALATWMRHTPATAHLPLLVLSGYERVANRDAALAAGADEFMEKPVSARGLLICLARLMTHRQKPA